MNAEAYRERIAPPDTFKTQIYRIEETDQYLIIDYDATPCPHEWVMVERLSAIEIVIEPYRGQGFYGVVRMLKSYAPNAKGLESA